MLIRRVAFNGALPKPVVFSTLSQAGSNGDLLPSDFDGRERLRQKVIIPAGILRPAPIRSNQEIKTVHLEIGDRSHMWLAGPAPNGMQQQDGLREQQGADDPTAGPDGKGIKAP